MEAAEDPLGLQPAKHVPSNPTAWQNKLLPLMRFTLIGLACFFFVASCLQLVYLNREILSSPTIDIEKAVFASQPGTQQTQQQSLDATRLKALAILEANATTAQYHQAGVLLAGRLWTTYLGFVTGMILAFVGATFVLGKLQESDSELSAKTNQIDISFKSASPGLVLAVLGVVLMVCTILTHNEIDVTHRATYLGESMTPESDDNQRSTPTPKTGEQPVVTPKAAEKPPPLVIPKDTK